MGIPKVVFQPETHQGMQGGINQLAEAIRPTLGPLSRIVAINSLGGDKAPELLDSGGIIARRIIELPHRTADMGAMYLRHILWQVQEEVGDGVATTAVLFQTIYNEGVHYIAAGGNAMILRHHLESGLGLILEEINRMTVPLTGPNQLVRMAESVCYDPPLAKTLGEIFDLIGEYGRLEIRTDYSPEINREYVEGSYWDSNSLLTQTEYGLPSKVKRELPNASILVSDFDLEAPSEMLVFLDKMHKAGLFNLILITKSLSAGVLALLHQANQEANRFKIIAVKTPGTAFIDQTAL
ncbi:MAG: hypothetical protein KDF65_02780, partial [Anaerolineae bacterium]|nr:hypothetical protein [Anaerolineae bacterium]